MEKHSSVPIQVIPLKREELRKQGIYTRTQDPTIHRVYVLPLFRAVFAKLQRMGDVCGRRFLVVGGY